MNYRPPDLRDGTLQDIVHICSSMEQLLLSYKTGEMPYIYIANLLELLFQSARTRICVLRKPTLGHGNVFSLEEVDKLVVFATFRKQEVYRAFLEQLVSRLHKYGGEFLERECERLDHKNGCFYICLARVYPEEQKVVIGRYRSKEAYHRLTTLLRLLTEGSKTWGLDMPAELYACFNSDPDKRICKLSPSQKLGAPELQNSLQADVMSSRNESNEALLKPIKRWIEYVYEQNHGIPLVQVALPGQPSTDTGFSNLFFFMRINDAKDKQDHTDAGFKVKLVCPPQQRRQLSHFYHKYRGQTCNWHESGECKIGGMGQCLFTDYWAGLSESVTDDHLLDKHYAPLWDQLTVASNSDYSKSEVAFRSSSIVFDRRQQQLLEEGGKGVVSGTTKRDRISACITFRMVASPDTQHDTHQEDNIPQIMYVPIYAGAAPFVLAATVVNAQLPESLNSTLSEWRRAYRFAGMVFQFMASRLKESARKAYLNSATNMIQGVYEAYRSSIEKFPYCDIEAETQFLKQANAELDDLSKIYPYHKIVLAKSTENVIKRERRDIIETPEGIVLQISLELNPYWRSFSEKPFISTEHVARKFSSGIARSVASSEKERREWQAFFFWHREKFKVSPFSKNGWREYAAEKGWKSTLDSGETSTDIRCDVTVKDNVVPFKK
ncbi:hypothetical protein [Candidatus Thiothrix anitrata]|uniref:ABM domain-containing protein n=1 Tax=Candidatus Thiothrix anitrata TaxID=2823902 RepID=A0ABX7X1Z3_9GAMM|nr:hypothetical protein [Candidatus Thiothrix anitrata]QTR49621.1 hypothetical protein J8380_15500 [Candidatus Thiothrix anitrata]